MSKINTTEMIVQDVAETFAIHERVDHTCSLAGCEEPNTRTTSVAFSFFDDTLDLDDGSAKDGTNRVILEFHDPDVLRAIHSQIGAFLKKSGW